ncbi:hypothetical protein ADE_22070 [Achromobacter denitrificans]|nr:hypothetical protein ADE_22070 [Achromobacter denitrificans]
MAPGAVADAPDEREVVGGMRFPRPDPGRAALRVRHAVQDAVLGGRAGDVLALVREEQAVGRAGGEGAALALLQGQREIAAVRAGAVLGQVVGRRGGQGGGRGGQDLAEQQGAGEQREVSV